MCMYVVRRHIWCHRNFVPSAPPHRYSPKTNPTPYEQSPAARPPSAYCPTILPVYFSSLACPEQAGKVPVHPLPTRTRAGPFEIRDVELMEPDVTLFAACSIESGGFLEGPTLIIERARLRSLVERTAFDRRHGEPRGSVETRTVEAARERPAHPPPQHGRYIGIELRARRGARRSGGDTRPLRMVCFFQAPCTKYAILSMRAVG